MSGESSQEKTEEPTPRQLQKARERGEVAQSKDLTSAVLLTVAAGVLGYQMADIGLGFQSMIRHVVDLAGRERLANGEVLAALFDSVREAGLLVAPLLVILLAFALLTPFLQIGVILSGDPLKPKLERLDPVAGIKRVFFSSQSHIEFFKSLFKVTALGLICWRVVVADLTEIAKMSRQPLMASAMQVMGTVGRLVAAILVFFFAMAVFDVLFQRWQHRKKLRMTKQQVKEEYKESEGDPHHKAERQRQHEEILNNEMMIQARSADVTVVNPTHYACSIRYRPRKDDAPRLVAKGRGAVARRIRDISKEEGVEIVRNVSLARALHELELNEEIPEELYEAVAEVLRWLETVARFNGSTVPWVEEKEAIDGEVEPDE